MRRTWNSWTHYGPDRSSLPEALEEMRRGWDEARQDLEWTRSSDMAEDERESASAQSVADALMRAMDRCDVRDERVARVKRAIESGIYHVPARELAQKLVKNMLGDYR